MFIKRKVLVITIGREEASLSLVNTAKKTIIKETKEKWVPENTEKTETLINSLIKTIGKSRVRLLLKDDVSYLMELPFSEKITRAEILSKVAEKVPEDLDEYSWDYKKETEEKIIAFAPVKKVYDTIVTPLRNAGIQIEAVEPEEIAKKRHENPIIGMALKKDIKGKDENVLNLKNKVPEPKKEDSSDETPKPKNNKNVLLVIISIFLFLCAGGIGTYYWLSNKTPEETLQETPIENKKPSETLEIQESTVAETLKVESPKIGIKDTKLLILNGVNTPGEAERVKDILETKGFTDIETGNAIGFPREMTEIQLKEETADIVLETIKETLSSEFNLKISEKYLEKDAENGVILIIGQKIE